MNAHGAMLKSSVASSKVARRSPLSSVSAAMRLLKAFAGGEMELGTTTLSERLGMSKSTIHRLASSLKAEGFLEQDSDTKRYRLGLQFFSLGAYARSRAQLSGLAMPVLEALRDISQEATALVVLDDDQTVVLANAECPHAVQMKFCDGERLPAHRTCAGRLLERLGRDAEAHSLSTTLSTKLGVVQDDSADEQGMRSMAVPVLGAGGRVVATIVVAGPSFRLSRKAADRLKPSLIDASRMLSLKLGAY